MNFKQMKRTTVVLFYQVVPYKKKKSFGICCALYHCQGVAYLFYPRGRQTLLQQPRWSHLQPTSLISQQISSLSSRSCRIIVVCLVVPACMTLELHRSEYCGLPQTVSMPFLSVLTMRHLSVLPSMSCQTVFSSFYCSFCSAFCSLRY